MGGRNDNEKCPYLFIVLARMRGRHERACARVRLTPVSGPAAAGAAKDYERCSESPAAGARWRAASSRGRWRSAPAARWRSAPAPPPTPTSRPGRAWTAAGRPGEATIAWRERTAARPHHAQTMPWRVCNYGGGRWLPQLVCAKRRRASRPSVDHRP